MKELIVRSISGLLYISIVIIALFASREWFFILFFILGLFTISEFQRLVHLRSYLSYVVFALLFFLLGYQQIDRNAIVLYAIMGGFVNLFLIKDLLVVSKIPMFEKKKYITLIFYIASGFIFLSLLPFSFGNFNPLLLIGLFTLIWANDSLAYLVGKNFGKHKLLERISPKKTVEGFLGGLVGAIIAGILIFKYTEIHSLKLWLILGVMASLLGTFGDLIQSKFKRQAGVKDSGALMPGHGGIYDRLDSMIFTSPFFYAVLQITDYVS